MVPMSKFVLPLDPRSLSQYPITRFSLCYNLSAYLQYLINQDPGSIKRKTKKKSKPQASSKSSSDSESLSETDDHEDDGVSPINYKLIYEYLYALLRGFSPPPLDPIESWVILDLISDTASELKVKSMIRGTLNGY
jgi:hypothetical protein